MDPLRTPAMIPKLTKGLLEHPAELSDTNYADDVRFYAIKFVQPKSRKHGPWFRLSTALTEFVLVMFKAYVRVLFRYLMLL